MQHKDGTKHGIDISKSRFDDIDRVVVEFALKYKGKKVAIDLGCGSGRVSIILALMGFDVLLVDTQDLSTHFKRVGEVLDISGKLHFMQKDIIDLRGKDLPIDITVVISQRTLHHLRYEHAKNILELVYSKMISGGKVFTSISGINSKLSDGYECSGSPVADRFCEVGEVGKTTYSIRGKVCLYKKKEVLDMLEGVGLRVDDIYKSAFGNIKAICTKSS